MHPVRGDEEYPVSVHLEAQWLIVLQIVGDLAEGALRLALLDVVADELLLDELAAAARLLLCGARVPALTGVGSQAMCRSAW